MTRLDEIRKRHENLPRFRNGEPDVHRPHTNLCYADLDRKELLDMIEVIGKGCFAQGYGHGHNDTVEAMFGDAESIADDWWKDANEDGTIDSILEGQ